MAEVRTRNVLDPLTLSKITNLQLRAQMVAEGLMSGLHRSRAKGSNVEFAEYREYIPGDDPKHIDWKAYGKLGRYYVKQFEEETTLRAYLVVDSSESMAYGRGAMTKLDYAVTAAAALAYMLLHQRDAVGLALFDAHVRRFLPARSQLGHLSPIAQALTEVRAHGTTSVADTIGELATKIPRRSLVAVFSDLLEDPEPAAKALASLRHHKHEVVVFHVMDTDELEFPFDHLTQFESMEDDRTVQADPLAIREQYLEEVARFIAAYRERLLAERIDYQLLDTSRPLDQALTWYLGWRERRR